MVGIVYRPKTQDTRQTYEVLLSFIQEALGDQPRDILCGAADEILAVLKNDKLKDRDRKREIDGLLGSVTDERFALLVNLGKKITDFGSETTVALGNINEEQIDEAYGINVQFEESEAESVDDDYGEIRDEFGDQEEGEESKNDGVIHSDAKLGVLESEKKEKGLHPLDIDAYWLQRRLRDYFQDPLVSQAKADEVLSILKDSNDDRDCENQMVLLLGYDCFDFIKILKKNRQMILFCTLLAKAQSETERQKLREQMKNDAALLKILRQLETGKGDDEEFEEKSKTKKRKTEEDDDAMDDGSKVEGARKILELDDLASHRDRISWPARSASCPMAHSENSARATKKSTYRP